MSLEAWCKNGWLRAYRTTPAQIAELFAIVDRDLADARAERLSTDWQFGIAYNAALKLCTILLYAEGYRPEKNLAHYRTLQALPLILGTGRPRRTSPVMARMQALPLILGTGRQGDADY